MHDLIGIGLAFFLSVIGIFFAYGAFGSAKTNSQIQETFIELQQARTEMGSYAAQTGGYGTTAFTTAQIKPLALLAFQAIHANATINQWWSTIAVTGNNTNFFTDHTKIDAISCTRPLPKAPATSGLTGIAVATSAAGLSAATVNALPIGAQIAAAACTATMAVRLVMSG